jgi:hypothetical protein
MKTMHHNHPGFEATATKIARKEGVDMSHARAILAYGARHAGKAAVKANPRLLRVKR